MSWDIIYTLSFKRFYFDITFIIWLALTSFEHANFLCKFFHQKRFERKWTLNSDFLPLDPRAIKKDNSIIWSEFLFECSFPTQKSDCLSKKGTKNMWEKKVSNRKYWFTWAPVWEAPVDVTKNWFSMKMNRSAFSMRWRYVCKIESKIFF